MKKFFLLLTLLFVTSDAWALNKFARTGGGNWTDNATWSTTSGGVADTTAPTSSDDVFLDANSGNVTISATSVGKSLTCTGYTGTLTHNAFTLTISGSITFVAGMTYTPADSAVLLLGINSTGTLTTGGKLLQCFTSSGTGTVTLGDNLDFVARKTTFIQVGVNNPIALNGKTVSGNSATNRLLIRSGTLGTASTITNTTGTFANADFRDIAFSTNADYSAITGNSGDCGGNSGITFTTGTTQTYTGGTGSWSDVTKWTSRVPLPQDDVSMSGVTGGTITADMPRLGKSIDWTGASGSPTWAVNSTANTHYGSLTLISAMTFTHNKTWTFETRTTSTLTSAGKSFGSTVALSMFGGTLTLQDSYASTSSTTQLNNGTFNANGFNVTVPFFNSSNSNTRSISMGSGTWTLTSSGGTSVWITSTTTGLTFNSGTSTILLSDITASSKTFAGGGLTYNDLKLAGGGAGAVIITGANTFNRIYTDGGGTKSITLPGSATTTILSGQGLANGSNVITFTASAGSATVSKTGGGNVDWKAVNLTNIIANTATGANYFAGAIPPSTDGGGNTGWIFQNAPNTKGRSGSMRNLFLDEVPRSRMAYV